LTPGSKQAMQRRKNCILWEKSSKNILFYHLSSTHCLRIMAFSTG